MFSKQNMDNNNNNIIKNTNKRLAVVKKPKKTKPKPVVILSDKIKKYYKNTKKSKRGVLLSRSVKETLRTFSYVYEIKVITKREYYYSDKKGKNNIRPIKEEILKQEIRVCPVTTHSDRLISIE